MSRARKDLGDGGEALAAAYLVGKGYQILARNFRTRMGELDIVAQEPGNRLIFVEVKTRRGNLYGSGAEAVTAAKQRHLLLAAEVFLSQRKLWDLPMRFDVVEITWRGDEPSIRHIENAFGA